MNTKVIKGLLNLLRPKQWVKNTFVLAPLIFSGQFIDSDAVLSVLIAALTFCIASSCTYILNDIKDVEKDKLHPIKSKKRPIAAGNVTIKQAYILLGGMYALLVIVGSQQLSVLYVVIAYLILNIAYTFVLKHQPVLDIFTIAVGFVLRVIAGSSALEIGISEWMFITTLCLALYLAAIKRRQELSLSGSSGRKVLEKYSVTLVDKYAEMSATGALIFYSMFVVSSKTELIVTVPLVLYGLYRYWYVVDVMGVGESPTDALFSDIQLQSTIVLWVVACSWVLWPR